MPPPPPHSHNTRTHARTRRTAIFSAACQLVARAPVREDKRARCRRASEQQVEANQVDRAHVDYVLLLTCVVRVWLMAAHTHCSDHSGEPIGVIFGAIFGADSLERTRDILQLILSAFAAAVAARLCAYFCERAAPLHRAPLSSDCSLWTCARAVIR